MDVRRLARDLTLGDLRTRREAAEELARRGPGAAAAAVALVQAADDEDDDVGEWAVAALEDLGPPRNADLRGLADLLTHTSPDTAYWAATLIGRSEIAAANCVGSLLQALEARREAAVRERVVWALGRIGVSASPAAAAIEAVAEAPDCPPRLARLCREALQSIRQPSANATTFR